MITKELLGQIYNSTGEEKRFLDQFINADQDSQFILYSAFRGDPFMLGSILATLEDERAQAIEDVEQRRLEVQAS